MSELPVPYCDPTCPHQTAPGSLSLCRCGGAELEMERRRAARQSVLTERYEQVVSPSRAKIDREAPKMIDPHNIAGIAELAALFIVGKTTVAMWYARADRNGFPLPIATLACGSLFDVTEVVTWYVGYLPLKGGRPGTVPRLTDGRYAPAGPSPH